MTAPATALTLYIGNKNYSSWSMRPWVLMREHGIAFREVKLRFDSFAPDSEFKKTISHISPAGKVPVLVDGNLVIWDSLAIVEYLAERFPQRHLWPEHAAQRARARSICAEMHTGFTALRSTLPMNIEAHLPEAGAIAWRDKPALRRDMQRIEALCGELLRNHHGPFLFGERFTIADAFYAPLVMRVQTYALPVSDTVRGYAQAICACPGVAAWIEDALAEHDFVVSEEPYRVQASGAHGD